MPVNYNYIHYNYLQNITELLQLLILYITLNRNLRKTILRLLLWHANV